MSQEELDLVELATRRVTESGACAAEAPEETWEPVFRNWLYCARRRGPATLEHRSAVWTAWAGGGRAGAHRGVPSGGAANAETIRLISARRASRRERAAYYTKD